MRREPALFVLTLLFFSLFAFSLNIQQVKGYEIIYIRADGRIDPPTASISTSDNVTYSFTGDLNGSITIERDNIVLDGAGFTLHGSGSGGGVSFSERDNVIVRNIEIKSFDAGIFFYNSSNITILNNNITKNFIYGVGLKSCSNCTISGNTVANNTNMGIVLWNFSHGIVIRRNNVMGNMLVGIEVSKFSSYNIIEENQVAKNHWGIFIDNSTNNEIVANDIMNCDYSVSLYWLSTSNTFYHNNFINSHTSHVEIVYMLPPNQPNIWDDGYPSGGNYWSDYTGVDFYRGPYQNETGSDGIGDTPYVISDPTERDNYPLMTPYRLFPWDVNNDGFVGIDDIVMVAEHFGTEPPFHNWDPKCDITGDSFVGIDDIVKVAEHFGEEP